MFYDVQYGQIQQFLDIKFLHLLKLSFFVATYYCVDLARWKWRIIDVEIYLFRGTCLPQECHDI